MGSGGSQKVFASVKSYSQRGKLLTKTELQTLAESRDLDELITRIKNTKYSDAVSKVNEPFTAGKIESALRSELAEIHYSISKTAGKSDILDAYYLKLSSSSTFDQALEMALKAEAIIYSISVNRGGFFGVGDTKNGDRIMKDFSEQTGGRAFFPFTVEDLDEAFRRINQELRSQYNIGYVSSNAARDGSYRKIDLRIGEKGLKLSFRKGYYAPSS